MRLQAVRRLFAWTGAGTSFSRSRGVVLNGGLTDRRCSPSDFLSRVLRFGGCVVAVLGIALRLCGYAVVFVFVFLCC